MSCPWPLDCKHHVQAQGDIPPTSAAVGDFCWVAESSKLWVYQGGGVWVHFPPTPLPPRPQVIVKGKGRQ